MQLFRRLRGAIPSRLRQDDGPNYFFFHFRAFRAKLALLRVLGFLEFFMDFSLETGIFFPFLAPADFLSLPRFDFLILIAIEITSDLHNLAKGGMLPV